MQVSCSSSKFLLRFGIYWCFLPYLILVHDGKMIILNSCTPSTCTSLPSHSPVNQSPPFFYLPAYLFTCLLVWTHEFLIFQWFKMNHFGAQIVPGLARSLKVAPGSLWHAPVLSYPFCFYLEDFLTFWHNKLFWDHLVSFLPQTWN